MSDTAHERIGHGDQYDPPQPDQRDHGPEAPAVVTGEADAPSDPVSEDPIAGQEVDTSGAPENPAESSTDAAGKDI